MRNLMRRFSRALGIYFYPGWTWSAAWTQAGREPDYTVQPGNDGAVQIVPRKP